MSVSAPIPAGVVSKIEGSVRVIRAGGKTAGALKVGDARQERDAVIATAGASLQLMADGGQAWETPAEGLPAGEALRVGEFDGLTIARETLLAQGQANLDDAVARLNEASEEDAPAAGLAGGATGALSEGLRVDRVQESVGSQEFEYGTTLVDPGTEPFLSGTINGEEAGNAAPVIDPASPRFDPVAGNYSVTTSEDSPVSGKVIASDADGDTLTYATGTPPANGSVTVGTDGAWTYTPKPDYNGSDSFTVTVSDGKGGTTTATVNVGVTPVNDAPLAVADAFSTAEDTAITFQAAQLLANDTDVDSSNLSIASVTSGKGGTAVLNADGTVTFTPNANFNGTADFSYTVTDGALTSAPATVTVTVTPVNDLPVIDPTSPNYDPATGNYSVTTDEDTPVSGQVVASDADGNPLTYAVGNAPAHGAVTVNPDGTWSYTPGANYNGSDSFTVTVSDGQGGTTSATVNVGITPVDDATVVANDIASVDEDSSVVIDVLANDTDIDSAKSPVISATQGSNGAVAINADGTLTYTPKANSSGADSFTYTNAEGNTATVNVTVNPVNDKPVVDRSSPNYNPNTGNYSVTTEEDTPVSGKVVASDADGDALTYALGTGPSNGAVTVNANGTWSYTPAANFNGSDSFTVTVSDENGGVATATVNVGVTPVNDAPVATADSATVAEGGNVRINLAGNDGDVDSALDLASIVITSAPAYGTVTVKSDGTVSYQHDGSETTADSFSYTIKDAQGLTSPPVSVTITVTGDNDAPVIDPISPGFDPVTGNYSVTTAEDTPVSGQVVGTDADGDTLAYALGTSPVSGTVTVNPNGTWTYTPSANFNGSDSFTVTVSDGNGGMATATVNVGVTPANDAPVIDPSSPGFDPVAGSYSVTTDEDTPVSGKVVASDVDGDTLTYAPGTPPANGSVTVGTDGTWTYTPNPDYSGSDSFTVTVSDGKGGTTTATINVGITPVDDATVVANDTASVDEDSSVVIDVLANDTDIDSAKSPVTSVTQGRNGAVAINADGTLTYTPKANFSGADSFTYTNAEGNTATVNVTVTPLNDKPVVAPTSPNYNPNTGNYSVTTAEDTPVSGQVVASDADGDTLAYAVGTSPVSGTVTVNPNGTWTYTPSANFNGADSFTVIVSDGNGGVATATVNVGVTPANDAPVVDPSSPGFDPVAGNYSGTTDEDTPVSGQVVGTDADGDTLTYALGASPANGNVSVNANGSWTYTPAANFNGSDSFTVTVSDGNGGVATATVNVGVTPANDVPVIDPSSQGFNPVAGNYSVTTDEDTPVSGKVVASDVDGDTLTYAPGTPPANGSVTVGTDGAWTYTPKPDYNGSDSFTVTVSDGKGGTTTATINVGITPVDDATVVRSDTASVDEDSSVVTDVLANDTDIDSAKSPVTSVTQGRNGAVAINADGTLTYTPKANFSGADSFTYTNAEGNTATVNVTVNPLNDAPVTSNQAKTTAEDTPVTGKVVASDVDGDTLSYSIQSAAAHGTLVLNTTTGDYTYTPTANYNGADNFTVRVSDGKGGFVDSVVNITVTPVNDAPIVGTASATLLESNLSGSKTTQSGVISVSDVDSNALTVRLTQPTAKLTSGGNAVVWTLSQDGKTLVGSAGSAEIIRASIDDQGNYSVTLSKPIDHATVQGQNTALFNIGVTASDGTLNTLSALSVNIIDDTPQTNAITDNLRVRTDNITVSNLDAGFTGDTYLNGTSQVTRTDVDSHDTYVDRLRWGNAATSAGQSGYDLVDNTTLTSSTGTSITEGTPFKLGDFTHTNYGIYSGSSTLAYTDVTIRLDVVINGVPTPVTFTVRLSHTETTNSNDLIASRDIITLPAQTVSIQIAGQSYTVSLLGFKDKAGNIVNTIYTDENTNNNTFGIYAQISSTQPPVQSSGELLSHAGADGAYLSEVVIDGTRYAYTPTNGGSLSVVSGTNRGTFNAGEQTLTVKTLLGGTFVVDLDGGQYTYTAPTTVTANFSDRFEFTVRDTDGDTASSSVVVNVAPPATVELSNNGIPYQAGSDPENINGSVGNDTIYGGNGADHINGGAGNDVLIGNAGNDLLFGGAGSDRIEGGLGLDRIQGGAGNDTLTGDVAGSPFADVFAWSLSDRGTGGNGRAVDTITDFSTAARAAGGDVLDLRDLLQGENTSGGVGNLTRYLDIDTSGADTVIRVSSTGSFSNGNYASGSEDQRIVLTGVNLRTDMGLSTTAGDQQVIQELLNRGKLLVDNS